MKCFVLDVKYEPSDSTTYIVQGIKGGEQPKGYVLGGCNGTFRMWGGAPADLVVFLRTETNEKLRISIGQDVRRIMNRVRLTERLAQKIIDAYPFTIEIDSDNRIIEADLVAWFSSV